MILKIALLCVALPKLVEKRLWNHIEGTAFSKFRLDWVEQVVAISASALPNA